MKGRRWGRNRRPHARRWGPDWFGLGALAMTGSFTIIGLVGLWLVIGGLWNMIDLKAHGEMVVGVVIESERTECETADPPDPNWPPPPPPPAPPPPMPPLRYLESTAPRSATVVADAGACGTSTVEIEFAGETYEREFDDFFEVGEEVEVLLDPEDPDDFILRESTDAGGFWASGFLLAFLIVWTGGSLRVAVKVFSEVF